MVHFIQSDIICKFQGQIVVIMTQGHNQDNKSGNFVRKTMKLQSNSCFAHAGPIAR